MSATVSGDACPVGLRGIVPSLNTPFTQDNRVDTESLARLVEVTVQAGCAGMLVNAVAGETGSLSPDEKAQVLQTVMTTNAERIPVIVGVSSEHGAERVALARMARTAGAAWALCQPPPHLRGAALRAVLEEVIAEGPPNLMVQDLDFGGAGFPVEELTDLFETLPAFRALKIETVPAGPKYSALLSATGGRLHVSGGWAVQQLPEALRRGVHAFIPSTMDRLYCRLYADFSQGREEAARERFEAMLPVLAFSNSHIHVALRFFKRLRVAEGVFSGDSVRPPVPPLDPWQAHEAERLIARVLAMQAELGH